MSRQRFPESRTQAIADEVRDNHHDGSALRGLIIGLLLTALVAGCVEMIL